MAGKQHKQTALPAQLMFVICHISYCQSTFLLHERRLKFGSQIACGSIAEEDIWSRENSTRLRVRASKYCTAIQQRPWKSVKYTVFHNPYPSIHKHTKSRYGEELPSSLLRLFYR